MEVVPRFHHTSPRDSMEAARLLHSLSVGLHGSCHVSTRLVGLHECDQIPSSPVPNVFHTTRVQRADQNCADLMRAEEHVTRRDVVSSQTEGNSVSVVEAVLRVDRFSHKIVQVHQ